MLHTAVLKSKFIDLVRWLRPQLAGCFLAPETVAVGLLERLWHAAISDAPRGNIGRLTNADIAERMGWHGSADDLITALVAFGWLDGSKEHRLLIHDWHVHAPNHVKGNVAKQGGFLTNPGPAPRPSLEAPPLGPAPEAQPLRVGAPNVTKRNETVDITPNEISTSLGGQPAASSGKPPGITRADAQPHAAELFRRLKIRRPEPLFWSVGSAVAAGVVPRTVPYDCADAALGKTNQVAYFRTVYLAECQKRGLMEHQALPRLPPGFGSFAPPEDNGPHYTPGGTGYEPSYDEESR